MTKFKLVPIEPSEEILDSILKNTQFNDDNRQLMAEAYKIMLAECQDVESESVGEFTGNFIGGVNGKATITVRCYNGIPEWGTKLYTSPQPSNDAGKKLKIADELINYVMGADDYDITYKDDECIYIKHFKDLVSLSRQEFLKLTMFENLSFAIENAKLSSNPFEFLCNQITVMENTEFSIKNKSTVSELEAKLTKVEADKIRLIKTLNIAADVIERYRHDARTIPTYGEIEIRLLLAEMEVIYD